MQSKSQDQEKCTVAIKKTNTYGITWEYITPLKMCWDFIFIYLFFGFFVKCVTCMCWNILHIYWHASPSGNIGKRFHQHPKHSEPNTMETTNKQRRKKNGMHKSWFGKKSTMFNVNCYYSSHTFRFFPTSARVSSVTRKTTIFSISNLLPIALFFIFTEEKNIYSRFIYRGFTFLLSATS